jgi:hypothetical protein
VSVVATAGIAALLFLALSIFHLDRFPPVHEDEPYVAASAAQLAAGATHGNPLFTGFHGAERQVFLYPPLLPVLQSFIFRVAGAGVVPMRIPSVAAGLAVLILAGILAARAGGAACGALTAILLVGLAVAAGLNGTSGVPLLDIARIARYDILVPAFGLAALITFERASASARGGGLLWFISGVLVGLATVAHLYGAFWLIGMMAVLVARRSARRGSTTEEVHGDRPEHGSFLRASGLIVAGFAIPLLPVAATIASNAAGFLGQQRIVAGRYRVLDPDFYIQNIINEPLRYGPLFGINGDWTALVLRPGLWIAAVTIVLSLARWVRHDVRERQRTTFAIGLVCLTNVILFALLVQVKTHNYLISVWTLAVILIAATVLEAWRAAGGESALAPAGALSDSDAPRVNRRPLPSRRNGQLRRLILAVALALVAVEGVLRITHWQAMAANTSPYIPFMRRVAAHIPPGSHVLGLQQYWLGLQEFRYTSWLLPVWWNDPRFTDGTLSFDEALERVAPDVVLIDVRMARYFDSLADSDHPDHERLLAWRRFAGRHDAVLVATIEDHTYGSMQVWRLQ